MSLSRDVPMPDVLQHFVITTIMVENTLGADSVLQCRLESWVLHTFRYRPRRKRSVMLAGVQQCDVRQQVMSSALASFAGLINVIKPVHDQLDCPIRLQNITQVTSQDKHR